MTLHMLYLPCTSHLLMTFPWLLNPSISFPTLLVRPDSISCLCRKSFWRANPLPLSSSPCVNTPSKVLLPASTLPTTATLHRKYKVIHLSNSCITEWKWCSTRRRSWYGVTTLLHRILVCLPGFSFKARRLRHFSGFCNQTGLTKIILSLLANTTRNIRGEQTLFFLQASVILALNSSGQGFSHCLIWPRKLILETS